MANKKFSEEEMSCLRANSYVLKVSPSIVNFSADFKEMFWKSIQEEKEPRDILMELGIDPDILGKSRIDGLKSLIRNEIRAGKGFRDLKTYEAYLKEYIDPETRIKHLEQKLAYKDQEIEFLKKIVALGREDSES
jgi:hypothetical protein